MQIKLVKNGIFPITNSPDGQLLKEKPGTGYDFPGTLQGEGKLAGVPVLFIRTSGCNLRCTWRTQSGAVSICDTPYASHYPSESESWEVDDILSVIRRNLGPIRHIIISGGEPTIQPLPLIELARKLKQKLKLHITMETNAVLFVPELLPWVDLYSLSPKLASSEPDKIKNKLLRQVVEETYIRDHKKFRMNIDSIQKYINACMHLGSYYGGPGETEPARRTDRDFQLKFVISGEKDIDEIKRDFLDKLSFVDPTDVVLMPLGGTPETLGENLKKTAMLAVKNGWRFTPRLQIDLFGDTAGT